VRGTNLGSPDCVHLATAIIYQADVFYTLDGGGKRGKANDLLPLNGNVAGYPLTIRKPLASQGSLLIGLQAQPSARVPLKVVPPRSFK
jgi:hypothetical protein